MYADDIFEVQNAFLQTALLDQSFQAGTGVQTIVIDGFIDSIDEVTLTPDSLVCLETTGNLDATVVFTWFSTVGNTITIDTDDPSILVGITTIKISSFYNDWNCNENVVLAD